MPRLMIEDGPEKGTTYDLGEGDGSYVVGRSTRCKIALSDPLMSRQHFRIEKSGDTITVTDLDSHNGTHVNGVLITEETVLKSGDRIRSGKTIIAIKLKGAAEAGKFAGKRIGDYLVHERIGVGGMGEIYKATQTSLGRTVAIKILSDELTGDKGFIEKFLSEARSAGRLNHPNVVQVHEVGQDKGTYYFSMEFIAGGSVQDIIRGGEKVDPKRAVDIIIGAAKALQYAEKQGVVHCDVKPDNLMLTEDGDVRLADLGIARRIREGRKIVQEEGVFGSPHYMAPEQAKGQPIDNRVDIYALGCSAYRMLAGRTPFQGDDARQIMEKQVYEVPPPLREFVPGLPRAFYSTLDKMMRKNPRDRYQAATELLADLEKAREELLAGKGSVQPSAVHTRTAPRVPTRRHSGAGASALVLAGIVVVAVLIVVVLGLGKGSDKALEYFQRSERSAREGDYEQAIELLEKAKRLTDDEALRKKINGELDRLRVVEDQTRLERAAQAEMEKIDAFLRSNPTSHLEARNRYRQLADNYRRLTIGALAAKKASDQDKLHEEAAQKAFDAAKDSADEAVLAGRYGEALRVWDEFPKIYDGTAAGAKSDEQPAAVRARAETDYKAALARGDELIRQEKFPEAVGVVDRFLYDVDLDEYRSRAQKDKARIRAKVDRAKGALAKQERAEQRGFAKALTREAEALRRAYDFSGARGLLRRAEGIYTDIGSKKEAEAIPGLIDEMNRQMILFESLVEQTRDVELTDNAVRLGDGTAGRAIGADESRLKIALSDGKTAAVPWGALSTKEFLTLMRACDLPPEQVFSLGHLCVEHGIGDEAVEEFTRAGRMRRAFKAEAKPFIEKAQKLDRSGAAGIRRADGAVWLKRIERLIVDRDFDAARTGLAILKARYLPAGAVKADDVSRVARMLPAAEGAEEAKSRSERIVGRISEAVTRVVGRKVAASVPVYRQRVEFIAWGDILLAAGRPAEARQVYGRQLAEEGSWWASSGAARLRIARAYLHEPGPAASAKGSEIASKVAAEAEGKVKAEAELVAGLASELPGIRRRVIEIEGASESRLDPKAFGELSQMLAEKLPLSLETRVSVERMRLAFPNDERVLDGRAGLWILRHRWATKDLVTKTRDGRRVGIWVDVEKLRKAHGELAKKHAAELGLICAEAHFNEGRWSEAKGAFEQYSALAGPDAEWIADGTVARRLKRCRIELSAAGAGGGG